MQSELWVLGTCVNQTVWAQLYWCPSRDNKHNQRTPVRSLGEWLTQVHTENLLAEVHLESSLLGGFQQPQLGDHYSFFPPIPFPFSTHHSVFATNEASILKEICLFYHTPLIHPKSRIQCAKRDWSPWEKRKRNHRVQICFMLLMYRDHIPKEPRKHDLDKTTEKQMENLLKIWIHHLEFKERLSLVQTSASWSRINQL